MPLDPAKRVEAKTTPVSPNDLRLILCRGHEQVFAEVPSRARLGVAWAQVNLETGRTKAAWNFNWGNVIATDKWAGKYHELNLPPPEPRFYRAYEDTDSGAADYWRVIARHDQRNGGQTLPAFDAGNPELAAAELRKTGYFTAQLTGYQRTLRALYDEYDRTFPNGGGLKRFTVAGIFIALATGAAWWLMRGG